MTRRSRTALKEFFKLGARPTREQFGDLIDSALNMDDEGFSKTPADGLKVVTIKHELGLLSFQRQLSPSVDWSLAFHDSTGSRLDLKPSRVKGDALPIIGFKAPDTAEPAQVLIQGDVGIGVDPPQYALDVKGMICTDGRIGREWTAPADGKPYAITPTLSGCVAFEVMAGVGGPEGHGRFALLHAIAMNVNNPIWWDDIFGIRRRIRSQHAFYSRRSDRLRLSWVRADDAGSDDEDPNEAHGKDAKFTLKIQTRSPYESESPKSATMIKAFVTQLWPPHVKPGQGQ